MAPMESAKTRRTKAGEGEREEAERRRAGNAFVAAVEAALEAAQHAHEEEGRGRRAVWQRAKRLIREGRRRRWRTKVAMMR